MLARADLVVGQVDVDAELLEREDRVAPHVGAGVERREVEVAALVERLASLVLEQEVLGLEADVEVSKPIALGALSARRRTWRGSPSYGVRSGVWMSQNIRATPCSSGRHGSTANVDGSGIAIMSDSSIALKPVIEEPSKPMPSSNASSSCSAPTQKDFSWPRMSVNQKRMKRMSRSSTSALTSSAVSGSAVGHRPGP